MSCSSLRRSGIALVNKWSHSFTCHPHIYPQVEGAIPAFTFQLQSFTAVWPVLPILLRVGGWVGLGGWLHIVYPGNKMVTHLCTNQARRRVTLNVITTIPHTYGLYKQYLRLFSEPARLCCGGHWHTNICGN